MIQHPGGLGGLGQGAQKIIIKVKGPYAKGSVPRGCSYGEMIG